ncbi:MAG: adenosylcobinamide-GDP ribazoletransferase [Nitrospiraceae bacterium]
MTKSTRPFVIAWQFLTAIPASGSCHDPEPQELAASMGWYPLVGLILGGMLVASDLLLSQVFSDRVVNGLLIVILVILTRGLHQDGLADTLDGLAGGRTPADRLAIMRDGRVGAIGATGLVLVLGLKYAGLADVPDEGRVPIVFCLPAVGRWAMVVSAVSAPYARAEGGLAQPFLTHLSARHVMGASLLLGLALFWAIGPVGALGCLAVLGLAASAMTLFARRFFGGITGDTLGAVNEIAEVLFLLMAPLFVGLS